MSDTPNDSSQKELSEWCEDLVIRISQQQAEIECLKAKLAQLEKAFKSDVTGNSDHIELIYQSLTEIFIQLWPLVYKVFPGSQKTQEQIANLIRNGGRSWNDKKPSD